MLSTRCCILLLAFLFVLLTLFDPESYIPRGVEGFEATITVDKLDIIKNGRLPFQPSTDLHQESSCHLYVNVERKVTCYERKTMEKAAKNNIVVEDDDLKGLLGRDYSPPKTYPLKHPVQTEMKDR